MQSRLSFQRILLIFIFFIVILLGIRFLYTGKFNYIFLLWNIFLAWIPYMISGYFRKIVYHSYWKKILVLGCWLLFFPNALYIVTDLIHLEIESSVPKWFDVILLFSCSIVSLMMAFVSLYRLETSLLKLFKYHVVEKIIAVTLFLGSFGVYLGRFMRWNSWDILRKPMPLSEEVFSQVIFPFSHLRTWGITLILTTLFYLLYISIKTLPRALQKAAN